MMDCTDYRRSILAEPHAPTAEMQAHRDACADCGRYTERLLRFESRLEHALRLNLPMPDTRPSPLDLSSRPDRWGHARPRRLRRGWLAAAASVLVAAVVAGGLWIAIPGRSLAADVVSHMAGEPDAWAQTDIPVPQRKLNEVLSESHVHLKSNAGLVSYAHSCEFRGHLVPHLVVQTSAGPVTVMVLADESLRRSVQFDEGGYRGVIVPVRSHGSLAVLTRGSSSDLTAVNAVAASVVSAIDWQ